MLDEIRESGGCLRLLLTAIPLAFVVWIVIALFLMAGAQVIDGLGWLP